jgi:hypothetical protein
MGENIPPKRRDDLTGIERFVAAAARRRAVLQHLDLDLADERADRGVIGARHVPQMQKQGPRASKIGMGAFIEGTRLVGKATRHEASKTGEGLEAHVVLQSAQSGVALDLRIGKRPPAGVGADP